MATRHQEVSSGDNRTGWTAHIQFWSPVALLVLVAFDASISRQMIGLIAQPIKVAYGLSDAQLGGITSASGLLVVALCPFFGHAADVYDRHKLLALSIAVWSIATAAYGLVGSYTGLVISFALVVAAEMMVGPICNSLVAGRYRGGDRLTANLSLFAAGTMTAGGGAIIAGFLLNWIPQSTNIHHLAGDPGSYWRAPLVFVAALGAPLVLGALAFGRDTRAEAPIMASSKALFLEYWNNHSRTFLPFCLANALFSIGALAIMSWIPIYLVRTFGISPAELGAEMGSVVVIADIIGIAFGLFAIRHLYGKYGPIAPRLIFQYSLVPIALLVLAMPLARGVWDFLVLLGIMNFIATFGLASCSNMLQDITPPAGRGKIYGLYILIVTLIGIPAPIIIGALSDRLSMDPQGLLWSVMSVTILAITASYGLYAFTNDAYLRTVANIADQDK